MTMNRTTSMIRRASLAAFMLVAAMQATSLAQPLTADAGNAATICSGAGTTLGGSPSASFGTSPYTYSWMPVTGLSSSTDANPYAYPSSSTTYTLTVTDAAFNTSTDTVTVTVIPSPVISPSSTNTLCYGTCDGSAAANASGPARPFTYYWTGGYTDSAVTSLCAGTYSLTVTNSLGCNAYGSVSINWPVPITLDVSPVQTICPGDTAQLYASVTSGGTPPFSYTWDNGSGVIPGTDTMYFAPLTGTSYTVSVSDANGCGAGNSTGIAVLPPTDIYGHVSYSGGALSAGTSNAVLFRYEPVHMTFDTVQAVAVSSGGDFHFIAPVHHDYLVEIFADTAAYPMLVPTYYGDRYLWDSAAVLSHDCSSNDSINISMVEIPSVTGPGIISGTVVQGDGFTRIPGEPIPGIDVKLGRNPGGQLVAGTTTSDPDGTYSFSDVPVNAPGEHYTIYVDIPGLVRDSTRNVTIDAAHTVFTNQDYIADSSAVYYIDATTGIMEDQAGAGSLNVYPNPSAAVTTIEYSVAGSAKVSLGIYNVLGVKAAELVDAEQNAGQYRYSFNPKNYNLRSGVYFIALNAGGKTMIRRLVIAE